MTNLNNLFGFEENLPEETHVWTAKDYEEYDAWYRKTFGDEAADADYEGWPEED